MSELPTERVLTCSFCGQTSDAVERLFAAPGAAICDGCLRSIAAADALVLPPSQASSAQLIGRWLKHGEGVSVSLRFSSEGLMYSTITAGDEVTNTLLHYSYDGRNLATVELMAIGERATDFVEIDGDTLTLRTPRGASIFERDKSDI